MAGEPFCLSDCSPLHVHVFQSSAPALTWYDPKQVSSVEDLPGYTMLLRKLLVISMYLLNMLHRISIRAPLSATCKPLHPE